MLASDDEMMDAVVVKVGEERAREEDPLEKGTGDGQGEKGKCGSGSSLYYVLNSTRASR